MIKVIPQKLPLKNEPQILTKQINQNSYRKFFPNVNEVIKEDSNDFKQKIDDLNETLNIKQVKARMKMIKNYLNLSFLLVEKIKNLINILDILVFQAIIQDFQIFFNQIFVKKFQKVMTSKLILKLAIFTAKILTQANQFLNFI